MKNEFKFDPSAVGEALNAAQKAVTDAGEVKSNMSSASAYTGKVQNVDLSFLSDGSYADTLDVVDGYDVTVLEMRESALQAMFSQEGFQSELVQWVNEDKITMQEFVAISNEYMRYLLKTDPNYYNSLRATPIGQSPAVVLAREFGITDSKEQHAFIQKINLGFSEYLIDNNLMYTGEGVVEFLNSYNGMFAMFGYRMGYENKEFDQSMQGFYLGTRNQYLPNIDCCNLYDWACRAVGLDVYAYGAGTHYFYGADVVGYPNSTPENQYRATYKDDYFYNAKVGDIMETAYDANAGHLRIIIGKDANGYYTVENGSNMKYAYYTFEQLKNTNYHISNMDAVYRNTSNANRTVAEIEGDKFYSFLANSEYVADQIRRNPEGSLFITPDAYVQELGLSQEYVAKLIKQYNSRNQRPNSQTIVELDVPTGDFSGNDVVVPEIEVSPEMQPSTGTPPIVPGTTPSTPGTTPDTPGTTPGTPGTAPSTPPVTDESDVVTLSVLPENKFSDVLPSVSTGSLGEMEIGKSMVSYELSGVNEEVYDKFVHDLTEKGYTYQNGVWVNGEYSVNVSINDEGTAMNIELNVIEKL